MKDFITPQERVTAASRITGSPLSLRAVAYLAALSFLLLGIHQVSELWRGFFFLVSGLSVAWIWVESDSRALSFYFGK